MTRQSFRLPDGGQIERSRPLHFTFNGRQYQGYAGDTLASALLANGVRLVGRSFKHHRPRGIFTSGLEEPNALILLGRGAYAEPNIRATEVPLFDGLEAYSQNCWPSVGWDLGSVNNCLAGLLPAGFYYKTFKGPQWLWPYYERVIRRAAGMGTAPRHPDPDHYHTRHAHCDVLIAGGGPAGLMAALAAGRAGARVIVADDGMRPGGALLGERQVIDDKPAGCWSADTLVELDGLPEVTVLTRTHVFGYYDHNELWLAQHGRSGPGEGPRQWLWQVRARRVVLATGAIERPLVFGHNDLPGVMLASAARTYANRYAVQAGKRAVIFTNNDSGYRAALDLAQADIPVAAIIDPRAEVTGSLPAAAREAGLRCLSGQVVVRGRGRRQLIGVEVAPLDAEQRAGRIRETIACDLLGVSGGWTPTVHLFSQSRGTLEFDANHQAFVPGQPAQATSCAGAINARYDLAACLREGAEAGVAAARAEKFEAKEPVLPDTGTAPSAVPEPLWIVKTADGAPAKSFVDLQNDVTVSDVELAAREGYQSVEHLKRYTTLGMGTDQGKTSNINGLTIMAELRDASIPEVGTTTFRPPYTPVTLGAIAGHETGSQFRPLRTTPMDEVHDQAGAVFGNSGAWRRPRYYPWAGESEQEAINREVSAVRASAGIVDVSTLGRIEVCGPDAAAFLNRVYVNRMDRLRVGRCRYGVMLREDGFVQDDGTVTRMAEDRFHITTTTANASHVLAHLERCRQQHWPGHEVYLTSVTDQWAAVALAGPRARTVLAALITGGDVSNEAFPFAHWQSFEIAGVSAGVFRVSYSGELAYEVLVPAGHGEWLWQALMETGQPHGITPYGLEAMDVLRIEKGHCTVGAEIDGRTTPDDLGLARMIPESGDFIGRYGLTRPALADTSNRRHLVGLRADGPISRGAHVVENPQAETPMRTEGHVTSTCYSPALGFHIALALVANGRQRSGESLHAMSPLTHDPVGVQIMDPVMFDPEGQRQHV